MTETKAETITKLLCKPYSYFPEANNIRKSDELYAYAEPIFIRLCHKRFKKRLAKKVIKRRHLKIDFVQEYNALRWRRVGEAIADGVMDMMGRTSFTRRILGM